MDRSGPWNLSATRLIAIPPAKFTNPQNPMRFHHTQYGLLHPNLTTLSRELIASLEAIDARLVHHRPTLN